MSALRNFGRRAAVGIVAAMCASATASEGYIHNIYLTTSRPAVARRGRWMVDISSPERLEDLIGELAGLGVNAMTYHSAYRIDGADYTPHHPDLKRAERWPAESKPVEWFLDTCARHGIAGALAVFIYPTYDHHKAVLATQDLVQVFRGRPGMTGYVPPIEGAPQRGHDSSAFLNICRWVKENAPELAIMDYPNGPYSPSIVQLIVARGASGLIDVENVQFHGADKRLKDFYVTRGMTHLVMGMSSRCRSIVHTHYRYGGSKPWLYRADAYKVRQEAVLTATPHGTSIFSFQHGFWGADSGPDEKEPDPMWRRLVWYEGIMAVQRMVPLLHDARPLADVAIVIPAHTREGGQELIERYWVPFIKEGVFPQMIAYQSQLSATARVIVCPSLEACDSTQRKQLEALVRAGRVVLVLLCTPKPDYAKWDSERTRRILGGTAPPRLDPKDISAEFMSALGGNDEDGFLRPVTKPTMLSLGKGVVLRMPSDLRLVEAELPGTVQRQDRLGARADNLPDGYLLELWRTRSGPPFVKILATREGLHAQGATLCLPGGNDSTAWFFDRARAEKLRPSVTDDGLRIRLPELNDEYAIILIGSTAAPTLRPATMVARGNAGGSIVTECRIVNTTDQPAIGAVRCSLPRGWPQPEVAAFDYRLKPGESKVCRLLVSIPKDVQRRPHFVQFKAGDAVQRCIVFPVDGRPQVVSRQPEPEYTPTSRTKRRPRLLSTEWRGVTAGDLRDSQVRGNVPGVCFLPRSQEWDSPAEHNGKVARYAEVIPRLGGANFFVNNPDPSADLEVRMSYCAKKAGHLWAYDGKKYHDLGPVPQADDWATATFRVPKDILASPNADRANHPGANVMFDVRVDGVYVHRIEARRVGGY